MNSNIPKKHFTEVEKQRIYQKWLVNQEAPKTRQETDVILEMQRRQSSKHTELEQSKKEWNRYFEENRGKIPNRFPKTIFDPDNDNTKTQSNN